MAAGATFFAQRKPKSKRHSAGHEAAGIARRHGSAAGHRYLARQNISAPLPAASTQLQQYGREHRREQAQARRAQAMHAQAQRLYKQGKRKEAMALNARARGLVGLGPTESPGIVGQTIERAGADIGSAAYHAPGAAIVTAKSVGQDVGAATQGDYSFKRSRALAKAIAESTYQDVRHPLRHPGFTALDLFAIASAGAGTAARVGGASRALSEGAGLRAALTKPAPGEIDLPGGAQALEHDNPLLNVVKRARVRRIVKAYESGRKQAPEALLPGKASKEFTAQSYLGRETRAREQVLADFENAAPEALKHRLKQLKPEERTALGIRAVEGFKATRDPAGTVARQAATHRELAAKARQRITDLQERVGEHPKLQQRVDRLRQRAIFNEEFARDLENALPVLSNPSRPFRETVVAARRESRRQENLLVSAGRLSQGGADVRRAKIAGVYGREGEAPPPGSFFFSAAERYQRPTIAGRGGPVSRRVSPTGLREPQIGRYVAGLKVPFSGRSVASGVEQRAGEAIAARGSGLARLGSAERLHKTMLEFASPRRRTEFDIPIAKTLTPEIRNEVAALAEEAATGDATALVRAETRMREILAPRPGTGTRYVDSRLIKEFATSARGLRAMSAFNKPFRFGGVYLRPAYVVTNRPQNFIMRHLAQGVHTKRPIRAGVKGIQRELGPEATAGLKALAGETRTESFQPSHWVSRRERAITEKIQNLTDSSERFLAVLARAHEKGYRSIEDLQRLGYGAAERGSKLENDRVSIGRRARKDMVDFSVTPGERTLSDFIYFYPWLSRGSVWAGRFVAEHPVKSAAIAQLGRESQRQGIGELGPAPTWMKGFLKTRLGLVNPNPLNTFSTPAQIVDAIKNPATARSVGEEFGTPAIQALTTEPKRIPSRVIASLAPLAVAQRAGVIGKPSKTFPHTGFGPAFGPFLFGGLYPRRPDEAQVSKQAYAELPSPERFQAKMKDLRTTFVQEIKKRGEKMPPTLKQQLDLHEQRYLAYKKAGIKSGQDDYQQRALSVDLKLLQRMGAATGAQVHEWNAWARTAKSDDISSERRKISLRYFPTDWINRAAKELDVKVPY